MPVQSIISQKVEILAKHPGFDGPKLISNQCLKFFERGLMPLPKMVLNELKSFCPRRMHASNIMQYFIALVHYLSCLGMTKFELP
jgi:hypothetical protein